MSQLKPKRRRITRAIVDTRLLNLLRQLYSTPLEVELRYRKLRIKSNYNEGPRAQRNYRSIREIKELSSLNSSLHMAFTGRPGTGKTSVAAKIALVLRSLKFIRTS